MFACLQGGKTPLKKSLLIFDESFPFEKMAAFKMPVHLESSVHLLGAVQTFLHYRLLLLSEGVDQQ